ncbi:MAG: hypothetical protein F6K54_07370 [Okeania sp. SIO3B5]|uniref:hypothetical protein n=1 Tax=Okeania sp. SIO3B5 TaxID=2607811 RepID=UPI001400101C|nr:hypothetical protein [Okeania sp. SIO3B5]NEO52913.1 hypothetical protein [Okeania sp. SIO3B5]
MLKPLSIKTFRFNQQALIINYQLSIIELSLPHNNNGNAPLPKNPPISLTPPFPLKILD